MSNKKLVIDGVRQIHGEEHTIHPGQLGRVIILHPEARRPLNPETNKEDEAFVRSVAVRQIHAGLGRINAQNDLELGPGSRRLRAIRDYINVDPARWGADEPRGYRVKIVAAKDELAMLDMLTAENLARSNPDAVNLAVLASLYLEKGLEQAEVASRLGFKSRGRVDQLLELLKHGDRVKDLIHRELLQEAQARDLIGLPPDVIDSVADRIENGEKAREIMRDAREARRAQGGKRLGRSLSEFRAEAAKLAPNSPAAAVIANLLAYFSGDTTVGSLEDALLDRGK
jgi:hypothetical protein